MGKLIEAVKCAEIISEKFNIPLADLVDVFAEIPTADVVEVKRGHWIEDEVCVYACSECGFIFTTADDISEFKYCRCGAKMDGKE